MQDLTSQLIDGKRFPYIVLRYHRKEAKAFLDQWWEGVDVSQLQRPYTLFDTDPILLPTFSKDHVDTISGRIAFPKLLRKLLDEGTFTKHRCLSRERFREEIVNYLVQSCAVCEDGPPVVYFTGGGYGAGKTSALSFLTTCGVLPDEMSLPTQQGVDYCKQLLPEFNMVKAVADGRASEICQEESRLISDMLFARLIAEKRSFAWDSSMSHRDATVAKIDAAKQQGYQIGLIAVLTDLDVAKRRAMLRARQLGRFAHPAFFDASHTNFRAHLQEYWDACDIGFLIENSRHRDPRLLDRKGTPAPRQPIPPSSNEPIPPI